MKIWNELLDTLISQITIEYNGTHNSDPKNPLWGRRAYWRVYVGGYGFACKITAEVKSINPKKQTLEKLFRNELKRRFEAVSEVVETDHYGQVCVVYRDPYGVKPLLKAIEGKYLHILNRIGA